jgi:hypothetical protein
MATSFKLKVKDYGVDGRIVTIAEKDIYNLDGEKLASDWIREPVKAIIEKTDAPQMTSAINVKNDGKGRFSNTAIGYIHNNANNVQYNQQLVGIYSSPFSAGQGVLIDSSNFERVIAVFAARKLIEANWINRYDEYMVPDVNHSEYQQFVNDALVFSLFESKSNQSSLRNITYKDKTWNILNHFFFMSTDEMKNLAITHNNNSIYNDCLAFPGDRFVFSRLQSTTLSPDAQTVLDKARELVRLSFPLRQAAHDIKPEYHLNAFDAGWYQIRNGILKESFAAQYKDFTDTFKAFADRLRPLVYTLGFLKQ